MTNIENVSKFLKTKSSGINLLAKGTFNVLIAGIIFFNQSFFIQSVSIIIFVYFVASCLFNVVEAIICIPKGIKLIALNVAQALLSLVIAVFVARNTTFVWTLIPLVMAVWSLFTAIASFISFMQYRKEVSSAPIRYFLTSIISLIFGLGFILNLTDSISLSLTFLGAYLLLMGLTNFAYATSSMLNNGQKARLKRRIRISPPPYVTALIPVRLLNSINDYLSKEQIQQEDLTISKDDSVPNVEVFVHVVPYGPGQMGHVDVCIEDRVISFGGYDLDSMKLGGVIGTGVFFENFNKPEYIKFCQEESDKTLFGFGLVLRDSELMAMTEYLEDLKKNTYMWQCKAEVAQLKGEDTSIYTDYASKLYKRTGAKYYKFNSGNFKYYWVFGTNCVRFADKMLASSGLDTVATGIITPGTYYNYLNNEFKRAGSRVVKRTIYHNPQSNK